METNLSLQNTQNFVNNELEEHLKNTESIYKLIPKINNLTNIIISAFKKEKKLLICGNGGSAADAQHFASELIGRYEKERSSFPAIALTTDTSAITSISNDFGFDNVFSRQIEGLGKPGDVLIVISTSGNSKNLIRAIETAKKNNIRCVALLGNQGGLISEMVDLKIIISSKRTCRIQEMHGLIIHIICGLIEISK